MDGGREEVGGPSSSPVAETLTIGGGPGPIRRRPQLPTGAAVAALILGGAAMTVAGLGAVAAYRGAVWRPCPAHADAADQLLALTRAELDAAVAADTGRLDRLLAPDYQLAAPDGEIVSRGQLLEAIATGDLDFHAIRLRSDQPAAVRVDCTSALVTYRSTIDVSAGVTRYRHDAQHTNIWVQTDDRWQLLRAQTTSIGSLADAGR